MNKELFLEESNKIKEELVSSGLKENTLDLGIRVWEKLRELSGKEGVIPHAGYKQDFVNSGEKSVFIDFLSMIMTIPDTGSRLQEMDKEIKRFVSEMDFYLNDRKS